MLKSRFLVMPSYLPTKTFTDLQVSERGGLRVQDGFFARFCIDRLGAGVQFLRDNPAGLPAAGSQQPASVLA